MREAGQAAQCGGGEGSERLPPPLASATCNYRFELGFGKENTGMAEERKGKQRRLHCFLPSPALRQKKLI
jgi:hypothetical protein